MTDIDDPDLTPQQRSVLRRADETPEHLTDHDVRTLGELLTDEGDDVRKTTAEVVESSSRADPRSFSGTVGPLIVALDDEVRSVRKSAAWSLGRIGEAAPEQVRDAVGPLVATLDEEGWLRGAAAEALGRLGGTAPEQVSEAIEPLIVALDDGELGVRCVAAEALGRIGSAAPEQVDEATGPLIATLDDEEQRVRYEAVWALGRIGGAAPEQVSEATGPLIAALDDEHWSVRKSAAWSLGRIGGAAPEQVRDAVGPLIAALDDEDENVRRPAAVALGVLGRTATDEEVIEVSVGLCDLLVDEDEAVRRAAAVAFGRLHAESDIRDNEEALERRFEGRRGPSELLATCLDGDSLGVAVAAAFALFRAGSTDPERRVTARDRLREGLDSTEHCQETVELVAELAETAPAIHPMMREVFADEDAEDAAVRDLVPDLVALLDDNRAAVRRHSCRALGGLAAEPAVDDLERLASEDDDEAVREAASEALGGIEPADDGGEVADTDPDSEADTDPDGVVGTADATATDSRPEVATVVPEPDTEFSYDAIERGTTLGRGAADVYEARVPDGEGSRRVVLKEPRFAGRLDPETREEFLDEARYWALVTDHPHVVDLVAWGDDPHPWLVAEYLDGGDLSGHEADLDEALWICARIADALQEAHHLGLRHLDLKPENVLLRRVEDNPWDVPKVSDWGLARFQMEHSGRLSSFTPRYGAPEQFLPDEFGGVDARTDLYQLGVILYELTTGAHPFPDRSGRVATDRLRESPRPLTEVDGSLPSSLDDITARLLEPRPGDRYDSAAVVRNALDRLRTGEAVARDALADRADLYASALEYARGESLRECQRWAEEMRKFVVNNPVEDAAYETVRAEVTSFVEEWFAGHETAYGRDHELVVGGSADLADENPELHHDIADVAEAVRRLYLRSA